MFTCYLEKALIPIKVQTNNDINTQCRLENVTKNIPPEKLINILKEDLLYPIKQESSMKKKQS